MDYSTKVYQHLEYLYLEVKKLTDSNSQLYIKDLVDKQFGCPDTTDESRRMLLDSAGIMLLNIYDYISNESIFEDTLDVDLINDLMNRCYNVSIGYEEKAFDILEMEVAFRLREFRS
jgi:hypothetical protein